MVLTLNINPLDTVEDVITQTLDEYIDASTRAVRTLADILGGDTVPKRKPG